MHWVSDDWSIHENKVTDTMKPLDAIGVRVALLQSLYTCMNFTERPSILWSSKEEASWKSAWLRFCFLKELALRYLLCISPLSLKLPPCPIVASFFTFTWHETRVSLFPKPNLLQHCATQLLLERAENGGQDQDHGRWRGDKTIYDNPRESGAVKCSKASSKLWVGGKPVNTRHFLLSTNCSLRSNSKPPIVAW
jgi:hypothetical protein